MTSPTPGSRSSPPDRSREIALLQLSARTELSETGARRLEDLLTGTIDWGYVLSVGGLHGVLPLLHIHLDRQEAVPVAVREALRGRCERVVRSNLHLSSQLVQIASALDEAGVPNLALKGPAVASRLYGNLFLREFGDVDILVRSEHIPHATRIVESLDFVPWQSLSGAQEEVLPHVEYSRTFTRSSDELDLDLHWDLARSFFRGRIEAASLWADTASFDLHGREVRCLPPDLMLMALCVHGAKHGPFPWPRMKWVCDVAEFVRRSGTFDWEAALLRAGELGCRRATLLGLCLSQPLLDEGLPPPVAQALASEQRVVRLGGRVWDWLSSDTPVSLSFSEHVGVDLTLIDGPAGRWAYGIRRILTPTKKDWASRTLPRYLAFLYVPLRIGRLARQYVPRPWRMRQLLRTDSSGSSSDADS